MRPLARKWSLSSPPATAKHKPGKWQLRMQVSFSKTFSAALAFARPLPRSPFRPHIPFHSTRLNYDVEVWLAMRQTTGTLLTVGAVGCLGPQPRAGQRGGSPDRACTRKKDVLRDAPDGSISGSHPFFACDPSLQLAGWYQSGSTSIGAHEDVVATHSLMSARVAGLLDCATQPPAEPEAWRFDPPRSC